MAKPPLDLEVSSMLSQHFAELFAKNFDKELMTATVANAPPSEDKSMLEKLKDLKKKIGKKSNVYVSNVATYDTNFHWKTESQPKINHVFEIDCNKRLLDELSMAYLYQYAKQVLTSDHMTGTESVTDFKVETFWKVRLAASFEFSLNALQWDFRVYALSKMTKYPHKLLYGLCMPDDAFELGQENFWTCLERFRLYYELE